MRIRNVPIFAALVLAACVDQPTAVPPAPEPEPPPPLGVYRITVTGIGSESPSADVAVVMEDGASLSLSEAPAGLALEAVSTSSFSEGGRAEEGHRYISSVFRVRNLTGGPVSNVTFIPVSSASTIAGTPFLAIRKFDNTSASATLATKFVPTGAVALGQDLEMLALYPDVIQVYEESEVAAISLPAGKTGIFPYGFVVRNASSVTRTIPAATGPNDFGGVLTITYRVPLASGPANDVFSFVFDAIAVQDTETRLTESIEEAQDTAAVRRLRARATALSATTVTVLNGSGRMSPSEPNYPGQRQLCTVRTAGTPGSPVTFMNAPAAYTRLMVLLPGENLNFCAANFRTGTPARPATNVLFTLRMRAMDRYGNLRTEAVDTVRLHLDAGPPGIVTSGTALTSGGAPRPVTYTDYGVSLVRAQGRRFAARESITVAGVTRTWTAGAGTTDWHTGGNWQGGAVPMSLDSVLVPTTPSGGAIFPQLAANVPIMGVTVENGATINLSAFDLTAGANVTTGTSGGISSTSGRLVLAGVGRTFHGVLPRLRVTGTYSLTGNVTTRTPVEVPLGRITNSSFRIQATSF